MGNAGIGLLGDMVMHKLPPSRLSHPKFLGKELMIAGIHLYALMTENKTGATI